MDVIKFKINLLHNSLKPALILPHFGKVSANKLTQLLSPGVCEQKRLKKGLLGRGEIDVR